MLAYGERKQLDLDFTLYLLKRRSGYYPALLFLFHANAHDLTHLIVDVLDLPERLFKAMLRPIPAALLSLEKKSLKAQNEQPTHAVPGGCVGFSTNKEERDEKNVYAVGRHVPFGGAGLQFV